MSELTNEKVQFNLDIKFWCRHLLSQMDRDPLSPTAGCFDRKYWAWKARDFADSTLQYAAVPLLKALKFSTDTLPATERQYYFDATVLAAQYLCKLQHRNGSLDQTYPYENHPGVVFDVLPLWIYLLQDFGHALSPQISRQLEESVERGINYILRTDENYAIISNHLAHFSYVLILIDNHWQRAECRTLAHSYLEIILSHQSSEGWYQEYDGPDMGYQTRTLSYLARILQLQPEMRDVKNSARRAIDFLACFAYPDGSFGGEIGSRNVAMIYPFGLTWFAQEDPMASALLNFAINSYNSGRGVLLHHTDFDNTVRLFDDQLEAHELLREAKLKTPQKLPMEQNFWDCDYEQAGIVIRRRYWYYAVVNLAKGGIYNIFNVSERALGQSDTGWVYKKGQEMYSNHMQQISPVLNIEQDASKISGQFYRTTHETLSPLQLIILRILNLTLWRFQFLGDLAKKLIARRLFLTRTPADIHFVRIFYWGEEIQIDTTLNWSTSEQRQIWLTSNFTSIPMASAKYFQANDIDRARPLTSLCMSSGEQHTLIIKESDKDD